ncbi:MAG: hypothetical protein P0116_14665 [Candidatus Nitrosocosmicus sp.]|nr:hypothetical protein [Candidatus Nitrosocosmicus sp.]
MTEKQYINEENPDLSTIEKIHAFRKYMKSKYGGIEEIETTVVFVHVKKNDYIIRWVDLNFLIWDEKYRNQDSVKKNQYGGF